MCAEGIHDDVTLEDRQVELAQRQHAPVGGVFIVEGLPAQHFADGDVLFQRPLPVAAPPHKRLVLRLRLRVDPVGEALHVVLGRLPRMQDEPVRRSGVVDVDLPIRQPVAQLLSNVGPRDKHAPVAPTQPRRYVGPEHREALVVPAKKVSDVVAHGGVHPDKTHRDRCIAENEGPGTERRGT
jgi:hypothetical protein